jgi:DivIVA domain-containing protein
MPPAPDSQDNITSLSPDEIAAKRFLVALRGYDKDEVDSFLQQVGRQMRELLLMVDSGDETFQKLGAEVAEMARSAATAAAKIRSRAEDEAAQLRAAADKEIAELRRAFDEAQARARDDLEREHQDRLAADSASTAAAKRAADELNATASVALQAAQERRAEAERDAAAIRANALQEALAIRNGVREWLEQSLRELTTSSDALAERETRARDVISPVPPAGG